MPLPELADIRNRVADRIPEKMRLHDDEGAKIWHRIAVTIGGAAAIAGGITYAGYHEVRTDFELASSLSVDASHKIANFDVVPPQFLDSSTDTTKPKVATLQLLTGDTCEVTYKTNWHTKSGLMRLLEHDRAVVDKNLNCPEITPALPTAPTKSQPSPSNSPSSKVTKSSSKHKK